MCIICFSPFTKNFDLNHLINGFSANRDGAGFAVSDGEQLITEKGFFTFEKFWEKFKDYNKPHYSKLVHFRIKTHAAINAENCHPFKITDDIVMAHNGVLKQFADRSKPNSDTSQFVDKILKPALTKNPNIYKEEWFQYLIEEYIGTGNKIIILDKDGNFEIFRGEFGEWNNGNWFSNNTYLNYKSRNTWIGCCQSNGRENGVSSDALLGGPRLIGYNKSKETDNFNLSEENLNKLDEELEKLNNSSINSSINNFKKTQPLILNDEIKIGF